VKTPATARRLWSYPAALAGVAAGVLLCGCRAPKIEERRLGVIPPGIVRESFQVSADARHVLFVAHVGNRQAVFLDGRPGKEYDNIGRTVLTPRGQAVYAATVGDKGLVVANGREGKLYDAVGALLVTGSGEVMFPGKCGERRAMVINGREGKWYDDIANPATSADGRHLAYAAAVEGKWTMVWDSREGKRYDEVSPPVFSPDGKHIAYAARQDTLWCLVIDATEGKAYNHISGNIRLGPDAGHYAFVAMKGREMLAVHDGREGDYYTLIAVMLATDDVSSIAYAAEFGDSVSVVSNGVAGKTYRRIRGLALGSGGHVAYGAVLGEKRECMVVDGLEGRVYDFVGQPTISPDGRRVAYAAVQGGIQTVVVDDRPGNAFYETIGKLEFSPDSKRVAYVAGRGGRFSVVVDGQEGPWFDAIIESPALFSPDGRHVAYGAAHGAKKVLVSDGRECSPEYDGIRQVVFGGSDRVGFIALRADSLLAVSCPLP